MQSFQREVAKQLNLTQQLLDSIPVPVHYKDRQGNYLGCNHAFGEIMNMPRSEIRGKTVFDVAPLEIAQKYREMDDALFDNPGTQVYDVMISGADGTPRHVVCHMATFNNPEGEVGGLVGAFIDITELKRVERELENHRQHLESIVEERTAELNLAKEAAEIAVVAKGSFLANMNHEIRTPLNAIVGFGHLIAQAGLNATQLIHMAKLVTACQHLLKIIDDVLDISKIEAGKLIIEELPINIGDIIDNVGSMLNSKIGEKGIAYCVDTEMLPFTLLGDSTRIQQALLNYVGNAIKFTECGSIIVRTKLVFQDNESATLRFEVEDTGVGISPTVIPRLFNAFEQADNSITRNYGGTGLGLSITKKISEVMGGKVGVSSVLGVGSTFWFTVVLRKEGDRPMPSSPIIRMNEIEQTLRSHHAGKRILLADDEPINCEIAQLLLEDVYLQVDIAENGQQAVEKACVRYYDLILMDMQMPVLDGLLATRRIREIGGYENVPILAITANAYSQQRAKCQDAGMNDFISKPVSPENLYMTVLRWLSVGKSLR